MHQFIMFHWFDYYLKVFFRHPMMNLLRPKFHYFNYYPKLLLIQESIMHQFIMFHWFDYYLKVFFRHPMMNLFMKEFMINWCFISLIHRFLHSMFNLLCCLE